MKSSEENTAPCPRCKQPRICHASDIAACGCCAIQLSERERRFISSLGYDDCLCNGCLLQLKEEYHRACY